MKLRLVTCLVALMSTIHADFVTGTLVQIPGSQVCVETLKKGDIVIAYNRAKAKLITAKVQNLSKSTARCYYEIDTGESLMHAPFGEKLFDPVAKKWIEVEKLTSTNSLFGLDRRPHTNLKITKHDRQTPTIKVTVDKPHNLFVGEEPVLAHNFGPAIPILTYTATALGIGSSTAAGGFTIFGITFGGGAIITVEGGAAAAAAGGGFLFWLKKAWQNRKVVTGAIQAGQAVAKVAPQMVKAAPAVVRAARKVTPEVAAVTKKILENKDLSKLLLGFVQIFKPDAHLASLPAVAQTAAQTVEHVATAANIIKKVAEPIIQNAAPIIQNLGPVVVENATSVAQTVAPVLQNVSQAIPSSSISSVLSQGTRTAIEYGTHLAKNLATAAKKPMIAGSLAVGGALAIAPQIALPVAEMPVTNFEWISSLTGTYANLEQQFIQKDLLKLLSSVFSLNGADCKIGTNPAVTRGLGIIREAHTLNKQGHTLKTRHILRSQLSALRKECAPQLPATFLQEVDSLTAKYAQDFDVHAKTLKSCGGDITDSAKLKDVECQPKLDDKLSEKDFCKSPEMKQELKPCGVEQKLEDDELSTACGYAAQAAPAFIASTKPKSTAEEVLESSSSDSTKVLISAENETAFTNEEKAEVDAILKIILEDIKKQAQQEISDETIHRILKEYAKSEFLKNKKLGTCTEHNAKTFKDMHSHVPDELIGVFLDNAELEALAKKFDWQYLSPVECGPRKILLIDYEHIFGLIVRLNCKNGSMKIVGCHKDLQKILKKTETIKHAAFQKREDGVYHAELSFGTVSKQSTFFPDSWSEEKVIEKILEALNNVKKTDRQNNIRWKLLGKTKDEVEIEIVLDILNDNIAKIVSAYPAWEQ